MPRDHVFITYTHPSDRHDETNRHTVAQYVGRYYRNRSAPTANPQRQSGRQTRLSPARIPHDGHGIRVDPFSSTPTEYRDCIPSAIDFCKSPTHASPTLLTKHSPERICTHPLHPRGSGRDRELFPVCIAEEILL